MLRPTQDVSLGLDYHGTPAEQLQRLFQDCGVSLDKVHELMRELPNEGHANRQLDWFFAKVNYVRYPIDEHIFRRCKWIAFPFAQPHKDRYGDVIRVENTP